MFPNRRETSTLWAAVKSVPQTQPVADHEKVCFRERATVTRTRGGTSAIKADEKRKSGESREKGRGHAATDEKNEKIRRTSAV